MRIEPRGDTATTSTLPTARCPPRATSSSRGRRTSERRPATALFTETKGGKTYALLMALPPASAKPGRRVPREITYIIDTSGSMEGVSMAQARDALLMALDRLQPGDRFNVIEFNSITRSLFAAPVRVDAATMQRAKQFVGGLRARGGTEMLPALEIALAGAREASMLRQVVFLTDGAVGNEDADPEARRRAHRRPAPLHRRHRSRAQHVLHDQGRAVRPRHRTPRSATCAK